MAEAAFSIKDELKNVEDVLNADLFKSKKTKFTCIVDANVPYKVKTSRTILRQILWNLLST